jgi:hypothetical protein
VNSGNLLGFIVSTKGITVDPLKVEVITQFPPPCTVHQLQSLQGKENFLWFFVPNYDNIMKGFIQLLKKGVPFCWNEETQCLFDALRKALVLTPLLSSLYYNQYFLLCLATTKFSIGMVSAEEEDELQDHAIYYLSHTLLGPELKYSHVKKLTLETFCVIQ